MEMYSGSNSGSSNNAQSPHTVNKASCECLLEKLSDSLRILNLKPSENKKL